MLVMWRNPSEAAHALKEGFTPSISTVVVSQFSPPFVVTPTKPPEPEKTMVSASITCIDLTRELKSSDTSRLTLGRLSQYDVMDRIVSKVVDRVTAKR